jgi:hypothetical protein
LDPFLVIEQLVITLNVSNSRLTKLTFKVVTANTQRTRTITRMFVK